MDDFERRLRAGLRDLASEAEPSELLRPRTERAVRTARRKPYVIGAAAAAAAVVAAVLAVPDPDGGEGRLQVAAPTTTTTEGSAPAAPASAPVPAGWRPMAKAPIDGRAGATGTWSGSELLVWGGEDADGARNDGAAYDPATNTWRSIPAAPIAGRSRHGAAWIGRELIVFGGIADDPVKTLSDGAAYDPARRTWRVLPASGLAGRFRHVVVGAGNRLLVWGGQTTPVADEARVLADGAIYDVSTNRWTPLGRSPLAARGGAVAAAVGQQVHILGGDGGVDGARSLSDHAVVDLETGAWSDLQAPVPDGIGGLGMAVTATEAGSLFVWGGAGSRPGMVPSAKGAEYTPSSGRWTVTDPAKGLEAATFATAVPIGSTVVVWDTMQDAGARYDGGRWTALGRSGLAQRASAVVASSGRELLVWGGGHSEGGVESDGAVWSPGEAAADGPAPSCADRAGDGPLDEASVTDFARALARTRVESGTVDDCYSEGALGAYAETAAGDPGRDFLCLAECEGWRLTDVAVVSVAAADANSFEVVLRVAFRHADGRTTRGGEILFVGPGDSAAGASRAAVVRGVEHTATPE